MSAPSKDYAERIHGVVASLAHRVTAEEVAAGLASGIAGELGGRAVVIGLFDEARDRIRNLLAVGQPPDALERWSRQSIGESPLLSAVRDGEALFFRSRSDERRLDGGLDGGLDGLFGDGAGFVVPLQAAGRTLGLVGVSFDSVRELDAGERDFILALTALAAQSIERARLFEAEQAARAGADAARRRLEVILQQLPIAITIVARDGSAVFNEKVGRSTASPREARPRCGRPATPLR